MRGEVIHDMTQLGWGRNVVYSERRAGGCFKLGLVMTPIPSVGDVLQFSHGTMTCDFVDRWDNPRDGVTVEGRYDPTASP